MLKMRRAQVGYQINKLENWKGKGLTCKNRGMSRLIHTPRPCPTRSEDLFFVFFYFE